MLAPNKIFRRCSWFDFFATTRVVKNSENGESNRTHQELKKTKDFYVFLPPWTALPHPSRF